MFLSVHGGGLCLRGLCSGGGESVREPYGNVRAVRILLECILVTFSIWSTFAWTEKLCTHFSRLCGLNSSRNSSRLVNLKCEWTISRLTVNMVKNTRRQSLSAAGRESQ